MELTRDGAFGGTSSYSGTRVRIEETFCVASLAAISGDAGHHQWRMHEDEKT